MPGDIFYLNSSSSTPPPFVITTWPNFMSKIYLLHYLYCALKPRMQSTSDFYDNILHFVQHVYLSIQAKHSQLLSCVHMHNKYKFVIYGMSLASFIETLSVCRSCSHTPNINTYVYNGIKSAFDRKKYHTSIPYLTSRPIMIQIMINQFKRLHCWLSNYY